MSSTRRAAAAAAVAVLIAFGASGAEVAKAEENGGGAYTIYTCQAAGSWPDPEYVVRAEGDPRALAGAIRQLVKSLDSSRPVFGVKPLADVVDAALDQPRLNATVLGTFAAAALALAAGYLLRAVLFGVAPYDPSALAASVLALALVALGAIAIPARQASRISAMEAMKN